MHCAGTVMDPFLALPSHRMASWRASRDHFRTSLGLLSEFASNCLNWEANLKSLRLDLPFLEINPT